MSGCEMQIGFTLKQSVVFGTLPKPIFCFRPVEEGMVFCRSCIDRQQTDKRQLLREFGGSA